MRANAATTKEERDLQRALKQIDRQEEKITEYESGNRGFRESTLKSLTRQLERSAKALDELTALGDPVEQAQARLRELQGRVEALKSGLATATQSSGSGNDRQAARDTKRDAQNVQRALQQLDQIDRKLGRLKWENMVDDRNIAALERSLQKTRDTLDRVPDGVEGRNDVVSQLDMMTARVAEARTRVDGIVSGMEGAREQLAALMRSGQVAEDNRFLTDLESHTYAIIRAQHNGRLHFFNAGLDAKTYAGWAATIDATYARATDIEQRYQNMKRRDLEAVALELEAELGDIVLQRGTLSSFMGQGLGEIEASYQLLDNMRQEGKNYVRERMSRAIAAAQTLEASLDYTLLTTSDETAGAISYSQDVITVVSAFPDGKAYTPDIQAEYGAGTGEIQTIIARVYNTIVEQNAPKSHGYRGDDSDKLLDLAMSTFTDFRKDEKLLGGVIESEDWYREQRREIDAQGRETLIDRSHVTSWIFVEESGDRASQWPVTLTIDHLQNNRLSAFVDVKIRENPVSPYRVSRQDRLNIARRP